MISKDGFGELGSWIENPGTLIILLRSIGPNDFRKVRQTGRKGEEEIIGGFEFESLIVKQLMH